jgi:hypothetical protein
MKPKSPEYRARLLFFWLVLSSFGIMFAVLSWLQEANIIPSSAELGAWKGFLAVLTGLILYWLVARDITGGPGDK